MSNVISFPSTAKIRAAFEPLACRLIGDGIATGYEWCEDEDGDAYLVIFGAGPDRDETLIHVCSSDCGRAFSAYDFRCQMIAEGSVQAVISGLERWSKSGWAGSIG